MRASRLGDVDLDFHSVPFRSRVDPANGPARMSTMPTVRRGLDGLLSGDASSSSSMPRGVPRTMRCRRFDGRLHRTTTTAAAVRDGDGESSTWSRREALLLGKTAFVFGELVAFPWLTESATRPRAAGDEALRPGSWAWLESLLPAERDEESMVEAKRALETGEAALRAGDAEAAIAELRRVEVLAPREYKMNQRAGLSLSEAYKLAGDNAMYLEYKNRVWWWGRGLRWPGWYIIGYLSARSLYFDAKEDSDAEFTTGEAGILVPIWLGLLFLLVQYGLPDY